MRLTRTIPTLCAIAAVFALPCRAQVVIDELFESGYSRTVNNIAGGNLSILKARSGTVASTSVGSLAFDTTLKAGADQFWGYFTDVGANVGSHVQNGHVIIGVGQKLSVSLTFNLSTMPTDGTYGLRFGVFDDGGSRLTTDLGSGGNNAAFNPAPGYALFVPITGGGSLNNQLSIREHTTHNNNIFNASADFTQIGSTVGGAYSPLSAGVDYTLRFEIGRTDASTTLLSASITETSSSTIMTAGSVFFTGTQKSSFDWLAWRIPNPDGGGTTTFKQVLVEVSAVPEPSTLVLAGLGLASFVVWRRFRR